MTYPSQNAGAIATGANTFHRPYVGNGILGPSQVYSGLQDLLDTLLPHGAASLHSLTQSVGNAQSYEASFHVEGYAAKVTLTATGVADVWVDWNGDHDFKDAGERPVYGLNLGALYPQIDWSTPVAGDHSLMPGTKKEAKDHSLNPGVKKELKDSDHSLNPGNKPESPKPPGDGGGNPGTPGDGGGNPGTPGGGGSSDAPPVFVVPPAPTVVSGQPGAIVGPVSVTDVDTDVSLYTFTVLDANGQPTNQFVVQNGQLQLNPIVSIQPGSDPVSVFLQVELTDAQGNVTETFRSDQLTIQVENTFTVDPGTPGGGGSSDAPPVFVVPPAPTVVSGQPGAIVGPVSVTDVDTDVSLYTFTVLDANGQPTNQFVVQNGQLQLNPIVSIQPGSDPVSVFLQVQLTDAQGNVTDTFRSDLLTIAVSNGFTVGFGGGAGGGGSLVTYTEGAVPAVLASGLTLVAGAGSPTQIGSAAVQISGNYAAGQDFLSIGGVSATSGTVSGLQWEFDAATGTLTLIGDASVAVYQDALRQVTYFNSSQDPSTANRTISYVIGAAAAPLGQANLLVDVVAVDNPGIFQVPIAPSVVAGVPGAAIGQILVNDPDSTYTLSIGGGLDSQFEIVNGQLQLIAGQTLDTPGTVIEVPLIATDNATGATLTQSLFITVVPGASGDLLIGGFDGAGGAGGFTVTYIEQQTPPVAIAPGLTIAGGGAALSGASVAIVNFDAAQQESLGIAGQAGTSGAIAGTGITWSYDATTGILTFVSADAAAGTTPADYQTALRQVVYSNNSDNPSAVRSVNYSVDAGAGSAQGTATIGITPVNDAPTGITLSSTNVPLGALGAIVGEIEVIDPDDTDGFSFTVSDARFTVVDGPNGLQLRLVSGESLATPLDLDITVTDSGNPPGSFTQTFTITPGSSTLTPVPQDDLLFTEPASGAIQVWTLDNISEVVDANLVQINGQALSIPPGWSIIDTADFDGNGIADILWQGTDGANQVVGIWFMTPAGVLQNTAIIQLDGANALLDPGANDFQLVGGADMDGDGNVDLVVRDAVQDLTQIWLLDGTANPSILGGQAGVITLIDPRDGQPFRATNPGWSIDALGDFNGDGSIDLVYRWAEQSATTIVRMNGTNVAGFTGMPTIGSTFEIRAVGDFTGDGIEDILWRDNRFSQGVNTVDETILWTMSSDQTTGDFIATPSTVETVVPLLAGWEIVGSGDFNADNIHDIVFRNNLSDEVGIWLMDDGEVIATRFVTDERPVAPNPGQIAKINQPGQSWEISGVNEFG